MIKLIFQKILPKGQFIRSVTVLAGGTALGQGLVVLASPILTRLYLPEDLGLLTVYTTIVAIPVVFASWRYEVAIPLPEDDQTATNLLVLSLSIAAGMSFLMGLAVWFVGHKVVLWVNAPDLEAYLWLMPFSVLGMAVYKILNYWAIRKKAFSHIGRTKLSQSIGKVLTQVGLGLLNPNPLGLLLGDMVGQIGGSRTLAKLAKIPQNLLRQINLRSLYQVASRYRRFPLLSSGAALLNSIGVQLPLLLMASAYGSQVMGWLALGQRVISLPLSLIATSVGQVYLGESAKAVNTSPEQLLKLFTKVLGSMFLVAFPYIGFIALFAPMIFPIIFGSEWAESGRYVQLLSLMFLFQSIASPTGGILDILERQDLHLLREFSRIIIMSFAVITARIISSEPSLAIKLLSISGSISYLIYIGLSFKSIKDFLPK